MLLYRKKVKAENSAIKNHSQNPLVGFLHPKEIYYNISDFLLWLGTHVIFQYVSYSNATYRHLTVIIRYQEHLIIA